MLSIIYRQIFIGNESQANRKKTEMQGEIHRFSNYLGAMVKVFF
jgi:hypothetical protein